MADLRQQIACGVLAGFPDGVEASRGEWLLVDENDDEAYANPDDQDSLDVYVEKVIDEEGNVQERRFRVRVVVEEIL